MTRCLSKLFFMNIKWTSTEWECKASLPKYIRSLILNSGPKRAYFLISVRWWTQKWYDFVYHLHYPQDLRRKFQTGHIAGNYFSPLAVFCRPVFFSWPYLSCTRMGPRDATRGYNISHDRFSPYAIWQIPARRVHHSSTSWGTWYRNRVRNCDTVIEH